MKLSAILAPLIAAKVPHEVIMQTVQAWEAEQGDALERRRASDRERQERHRHVKSRDRHVTVSSRARVEDSSSKEDISGKENTAPAALSDLQAFRAELSDLDTERLEAIVKHRRSKKGQLTALSARLFVKDAGACGMSLSEAVDACISRGWLTVKPEYFRGRNSTAPPPPSKPRNAGEAARQELIRRGQYPNATSNPPRLVDTSDGNSGFAGTGIARRIALAASGGRTT